MAMSDLMALQQGLGLLKSMWRTAALHHPSLGFKSMKSRIKRWHPTMLHFWPS